VILDLVLPKLSVHYPYASACEAKGSTRRSDALLLDESRLRRQVEVPVKVHQKLFPRVLPNVPMESATVQFHDKNLAARLRLSPPESAQ
jgi:hypothetical protein